MIVGAEFEHFRALPITLAGRAVRALKTYWANWKYTRSQAKSAHLRQFAVLLCRGSEVFRFKITITVSSLGTLHNMTSARITQSRYLTGATWQIGSALNKYDKKWQTLLLSAACLPPRCTACQCSMHGSLANPFHWSLCVLSESMLVSHHFLLQPTPGALCTRSWINGREDILCRKCTGADFPPLWPLKGKKKVAKGRRSERKQYDKGAGTS